MSDENKEVDITDDLIKLATLSRIEALEKKVSIIAEMIQPEDFKLHFNFKEQIAELKKNFNDFVQGTGVAFFEAGKEIGDLKEKIDAWIDDIRIGKQRAYMEFVEKLENIIPKRGWWDSDMVQDNIEDLIDLYKEKSKNK